MYLSLPVNSIYSVKNMVNAQLKRNLEQQPGHTRECKNIQNQIKATKGINAESKGKGSGKKKKKKKLLRLAGAG